MIRAVILSAVLTLGAFASAQITSLQNPLPKDAQAALAEARAVAADALEAYDNPRPDQPRFREAIRLARRAVHLAPEHPETLRFLAEVYGVTGFYGPAFNIWGRFAEAGGALDRDARVQLARSGLQVGYARYHQGNPSGALAAYRRVTELVPGNTLAQRWVGRLLLEQDRPRNALPYWQRVAERRPDDAGAAYFLELTEAGIAHGLEAARAFYGGVSDYEAGRRERAQEKFTRATALAPDYAEAWGYLGRLAFEAGNFAEAETAYARASELAPQNETYRYFLQEARNRGAPPAQPD